MMDVEEKAKESVRLFQQHLGSVNDGTVLILKAHLLIEEMLFKRVKEYFAFPKYLEDANLRFFQLVCIARAIFPNVFGINAEIFSSWADKVSMWDQIIALNSLRNRLAHRLESDGNVDLLRRILGADATWSGSLDDPTTMRALAIMLARFLGVIAALGDARGTEMTRS